MSRQVDWSFLAIKPGFAVREDVLELARLEIAKRKLEVNREIDLQMTPEQAEQLYENCRLYGDYPHIIEYAQSGPWRLIEVIGKGDVIDAVCEIAGRNTKPAECEPGSLRYEKADLVLVIVEPWKNVVHREVTRAGRDIAYKIFGIKPPELTW